MQPDRLHPLRALREEAGAGPAALDEGRAVRPGAGEGLPAPRAICRPAGGRHLLPRRRLAVLQLREGRPGRSLPRAARLCAAAVIFWRRGGRGGRNHSAPRPVRRSGIWLSFPVVFGQLSALGEALLPALRGGGRAEGKRDEGS